MIKSLFWVCFSFLSLHSWAQTPEIEEWLSCIRNQKDDSMKVACFNNLAMVASDYGMDEKAFVAPALNLSRGLNVPTERAKALLLQSKQLTDRGQYDSALIVILEAKNFFPKRDSTANASLYAFYYFRLGSLLLPQGTDMDTMLDYFHTALRYARLTKDTYLISLCYAGVNTAHNRLRQFEKATQICNDFILFAEKTRDTLSLAKAYQNMATSQQNAGNKEQTSVFNRKFKALLPFLKSPYYQWLSVHNDALALTDEGKNSEAIRQSLVALEIADGYLTPAKRLASYYLTGYCFFVDSRYAESIRYILKTDKLADSIHSKEYKLYAASGLSDNYAALKDYKNAFLFASKQISLSDSILGEKEKINSNYLYIKYQMAQKEDRIKQQEDAIKQKNYLNLLLIGGSIALLIIFLLSYRNYRNKQKLQKQRISELETAQRLNAAQAVLKGEEQERTRLAKDLHDGLSGMLSGIKYSLQDMKGNLIMTEENRHAFERSMDMLDSSIQEMRRVAHNMMPEVLVRYGLDAALKDYIAEINKTGMINVVYQSMGMENREIESSSAIAIYRIIQELLNNVIKHAQATKALVQLFNENSKLVVNVEDNGRGFDTKLSEEKGGMGWRNIRSRVDLLKGILDLQSSSGSGTTVNIEFDLL